MNNDVVTLMTNAGEIVCRITDESADSYTLEHPRLFAQTAEGVGFVPGVCMTGINDPTELVIQKTAVLFTIPANENISKAWIQQTSGIIV